jgi:hypothetical protein
VFSAYTQLREDADKSLDYSGLNWASHIQSMLQSTGCFEVWLYQDSRAVMCGPLKSRLRDQYVQNWNIDVNNSLKLETYITFKLVIARLGLSYTYMSYVSLFANVYWCVLLGHAITHTRHEKYVACTHNIYSPRHVS